MPVHSFVSYNYSALAGGGGYIYLRPDYDPDLHLIRLDITEDAGDNTFDGDGVFDNVGDDSTQYGDFYAMDGSPMVSGQVYLEEMYQVQASGQPPIDIWLVSSGGMPAVYLTSESLVPGTNYLVLGGADVTSANAPLYSEIEGAPCFCAGTQIETESGLKVVETLVAGDRVQTRDHGLQSVVWVGHRDVTAFEQRGFANLMPVILNKNSIAPGCPNRPLYVSQQHRILIEGALPELYFGEEVVLVPAKALINGTSIRLTSQTRGVSYYHVLLADHAALNSNGLWSESLLSTEAARSALGTGSNAVLRSLSSSRHCSEHTAYPILKVSEGRILAPLPSATLALPRAA